MTTKSSKIVLLILSVFFASCSQETLTDSIIDTTPPQMNLTDTWIRTNFTNPYNIEVIYKWNDGQTTLEKNLIPPKEEFVKPLMLMLDSVWMQPFIEEGGADFFKRLAPKQFLLIGSSSYNDDGSRTQGQAESGRKIILYTVNSYNPINTNLLWAEYIHVVFHEFAHIMHQTKNFDIEYKNITPSYTVAWTNYQDATALQKGFVTAYSMSAPEEDFVEIMSIFLTTPPANWDARIETITNKDAKSAILKKLEIVVKYLKNSWNIDAYNLRIKVNAAINKVALSN